MLIKCEVCNHRLTSEAHFQACIVVPEVKIEDSVCRYARERGMGAYKFTSPSRRAVPDRIFFSPLGFVFFIEFKRTGEKATPAQAREHGKLRAYGQTVYVVDSIEEGKVIVDKYLIPWWTR